MPRVHGLRLHVLQPLEAGLRCPPVVDDAVQDRPVFVQQQVAAEQGTFCGQDRYGAFGVPRDVKDPGIEAVPGEIIAFVDIQIGAAPLRLVEPEEE